MSELPPEISTQCVSSYSRQSHRSAVPSLLLLFLASASRSYSYIIQPPPLSPCSSRRLGASSFLHQSRRRSRPEIVSLNSKPPSILEEESKVEDSAEITDSLNQELKNEDLVEDPIEWMVEEELLKDLKEAAMVSVSRRQWFQQSAALIAGSTVVGTAFMAASNHRPQQQTQPQPQQQQQQRSFVRLESYPYRKKPSSFLNYTDAINGIKSNATSLISGGNQTVTNNSTARSNATKANVTSAKSTSTKKTSVKGASSNNTSAASKSKSNIASNRTSKGSTATSTKTSPKELAPVNFTKVATENSINITLKDCKGGCVRVNGTTMQKVKTPEKELWFLPKFLRPAPKVIKDIPDTEIILAATVAGSVIEMGRTLLLYPLSTVKTRIQTRQQEKMKTKTVRKMQRFQSNSSLRLQVSHTNNTTNQSNTTAAYNSSTTATNHSTSSLAPPTKKGSTTKRGPASLNLRRRLRVLQLNIRRHTAEGNLYAGWIPSLLVSVPATGVYYGVRDVTKRALSVTQVAVLDDAIITLLGALVADVVSLAVRTPADALATRLQAAASSNTPSKPPTNSTTVAVSSIANETIVLPNNVTGISSLDEVRDGLDNKDYVFQSSSAVVAKKELSWTNAKQPDTVIEQPTAEEDWDREEAERYMQKESNMVVNDTRISDSLIASVLPGEYEHEEQLLLTLLQRKEYSVEKLMEGLDKPAQKYPAGLSKREIRRLKRKAKQSRTGEEKKESRFLASAPVEMKAHHVYTQDFVEALKEEGGWDDIIAVNVTELNDWDIALPTIKVDRSPPPAAAEQPFIDIIAQAINETLSYGGEPGEAEALVAQSANGTDQPGSPTDENPIIRMEDDEERQLVQELQIKNVYEEKWLQQSLERLPALIITDLPYLLSRIALNRILIHGKLNLGQYEIDTIAIAVFCALLTTPFDVVRTRLLVENDDQDSAGEANTTIVTADGNILLVGNMTEAEISLATADSTPLNQGVLQTMICIAKEGDGGVRNLYAGWFERTVYFGIGRAWLDPINIITYVGIRDTLLLQWFD